MGAYGKAFGRCFAQAGSRGDYSDCGIFSLNQGAKVLQLKIMRLWLGLWPAKPAKLAICLERPRPEMPQIVACCIADGVDRHHCAHMNSV